MKDLYDRLKALGFTRKFLHDCILPDWWEDSMAATPANRLQIEAILSRQLGLDLASLHDASTPTLRFQSSIEARFKKRLDTNLEQLLVAQALATRLAQIAAVSYEHVPVRLKEVTAGSIRDGVLQDEPCVGLSALLDFCWDVGIPVIHLCRKPAGSKKMDGAALRVGGRPVIAIACQRKQPAWQLFILAHELGHIALGHLLPDDNIWDDEVKSDRQETEEREANDFAVELLTGDRNTKFSPRYSWLNASDLAESARSLGEEMRIDPGVVALNYAWSQGFIQVGQAALKELEPEADAATLFREHYSRLDLDSLPEDSRRVFDCLTTPE